MINDQTPNTKTNQEDLDVGSFLSIINKTFTRLGKLISAFFLGIGNLILIVLLIIRKRIIWVVAGTLLGLAIGLYLYISWGPSYYSVLTTKSSYNSTRLLYNKIDYFNSLIKNNRTPELMAQFGITAKSAGSLLYFEIDPIKNDIEAAKVFRENFLRPRHTPVDQPDTMWSRTMKFKDFKDQMTMFDYPLHEVTLYSKDPDIYPKIQAGLLNAVNGDSSLKSFKEEAREIMLQEDSMLTKSLSDLDTLRKTYNVRLAKGSLPGSEGNNVYMNDGKRQNAEIELYDKTLIIKDELVALKMKNAEEANLITVQSSFNNTGTPVSKFRESFTKYALAGFLTVLGFFVLLEISDRLAKYEKTKLSR